jgi:hypothetical protein
MNTEKINKRVAFTMGGKGGAGKTGLIGPVAILPRRSSPALTVDSLRC